MSHIISTEENVDHMRETQIASFLYFYIVRLLLLFIVDL